MEQLNNFSNLRDASRPPPLLSRSTSSNPPHPVPPTRSTSTGSTSSKTGNAKDEVVGGSTRLGGAVSKFKTRGGASTLPQSPITPLSTTLNRTDTSAGILPSTSTSDTRFPLPPTASTSLPAEARLSKTQAKDLLGGWGGNTSTTRRTDLSEFLSRRVGGEGRTTGVVPPASQVHARLNNSGFGMKEQESVREEEDGQGGMDVDATEDESENEMNGGGDRVDSRSEDEDVYEIRTKEVSQEEESEEDEIGDDDEGCETSGGVKRRWEDTGEWETRYKRGRGRSEMSPHHFEEYEDDGQGAISHTLYGNGLPATDQTHDPLSSIADLYPAPLPQLRRAANLSSMNSQVWESKTMEEWKVGGDELVRKFGELMGRITGIIARKTKRTEEFEKEMKEHRDSLEARHEKMEGTSKNMKSWAANLFG